MMMTGEIWVEWLYAEFSEFPLHFRPCNHISLLATCVRLLEPAISSVYFDSQENWSLGKRFPDWATGWEHLWAEGVVWPLFICGFEGAKDASLRNQPFSLPFWSLTFLLLTYVSGLRFCKNNLYTFFPSCIFPFFGFLSELGLVLSSFPWRMV